MMGRSRAEKIGAVLAGLSLLILLFSKFSFPQNTAGILANQYTDVTFSSVAVGSNFSASNPKLTSGTLTQVKCLNIDPTSTTTNWFFWKTESALTVTHVRCIVDASTSVVMTLQECDGNGGSCGNTEAAITCATTTTSESGAVDDTAVASGAWMRVTRGAVTGSPTQAVLCMSYTIP